MGERADALASHIRQQREELGDNIRELNFRMKEAVDWRYRVRENPIGAMIAAAVVGFLFHALVRR
ncbi:MAG TPA: hypothetical protein VFW94_17010 [Candidatus Acidoferrales bacterium]|nr:hypothetical protein [Candidatus Acidoferrales bacterium]